MVKTDISELIIVATLIFLLAPCFLLLYVAIYNKRKKQHLTEKDEMKLAFEEELLKTQSEIKEQTLQTLGADLHDSIGQLLSLTSLTLGSIELDDLEKAQHKINAALDLNSRSIKELRQLGRLIQGEQLIETGLRMAIQHEINWIEKSGRYRISYIYDDGLNHLQNPDKDLIIFRMVQEILSNIIKHAGANEINVRLYYIDESIRLGISDNGKGFDPDELPNGEKGMGIHNMRKRAGIVGGQVSIRSTPDEGSFIELYIPYP